MKELENYMVIGNNAYWDCDGEDVEEVEEKPTKLWELFEKVLKEDGEEKALLMAKEIFCEIELPTAYEEEITNWAGEKYNCTRLWELFEKILKEDGEEEALSTAKEIFYEIELPAVYEEELVDWYME